METGKAHRWAGVLYAYMVDGGNLAALRAFSATAVLPLKHAGFPPPTV